MRAVLALSDAGFSTVSLVAHGRPTWAAEPLARRGVAVQWMGAPSVEPADSSDIDSGLVLVLAGDMLLDAAAGSALRKASAGPVRNGEGRLVGVVCAGRMRPRMSASPGSGRARRGPGRGSMSGLAVPLGTVRTLRATSSARCSSTSGPPDADSYLATLIDRPLSRPLTRLLLRTPLSPSHVTLLSMAAGLLGAVGLATVSYWGRLGGVLLLVLSIVLDCVDGDMARARLAQDPPAPGST